MKSLRKTVQTALLCSLLATAGLAGSARADSKDSKDKAMLKLVSRAGSVWPATASSLAPRAWTAWRLSARPGVMWRPNTGAKKAQRPS